MIGRKNKKLIFSMVCILLLTGLSSSIDAYITNPKIILIIENQTIFSINDSYEYVIITNEYLENSDFQRLIQHKSQYITSNIITIEEILSNPDFEINGLYGDGTNKSNGNHWIENNKEVKTNFSRFDDISARIRNFIRFAYDNWQTKYVLLGGDFQIIPDKELRINETLWYTGTNFIWTFANIKSDLYYGCLNGTWNDDFDEYFGEAKNYSIDEEADFIAEVYIGRAPVDNKRDVKIFVDKLISYETSEKPENMLFHQAGLNNINDPDSSVIPEKCYLHVPENYVVYKLYQIYTTIDEKKYARHWQNPEKLIVLQIGSGGTSYYYMERRISGDILFTYDDIKRLNNTFYPIHISISCNTGNFGLDHDCLAENLLLFPDTGPSSCIFNSFFGVVSKDDAHKYSGEYIEQQFYEIFQNDTNSLGEMVTKSKYWFIEKSKNDLLYRWCYYTVYLLGDPETPIFDIRNEIPIIDEVYVSKDFDENSQGWNITKFNNIQDAIDAVAGSGTIFVYNGSYNENLIIDKPLNLIGEDKHTTEIIGDGNGDVIKIFDEITISGFTIINSGMSQDNSAIKIYSKMNIIKNNTIKENNYGIKIETSAENDIIENVINKNNFINNNINTVDYNNNRFFGNYWDNYSGKDTNDDGIGDTPYNFESGSDLCPFYLESGWDSGINHEPVIPIISGPSTGKPNTPYSYDFVTADPDGDKVYIYIDMADGAFKNWVGPFDSCEVKNMLYYWERIGVYTIKAKAKDEYGVETDWITHKLTIPRYRAYDFPRYTLIDLFLNLLRIIRNFK